MAEAAEEADAADSDEPSEEEITNEEESESEDINEAGEEDDLSISDATEEDEEVVEEIEEEEEVVEETEEADTEDPSFSDSEEESDTTETEVVEEETEEEEEVVEEEVEEETETTEETVVEEETEAEALETIIQDTSDASKDVEMFFDGGTDAVTSGTAYIGTPVSLKIDTSKVVVKSDNDENEKTPSITGIKSISFTSGTPTTAAAPANITDASTDRDKTVSITPLAVGTAAIGVTVVLSTKPMGSDGNTEAVGDEVSITKTFNLTVADPFTSKTATIANIPANSDLKTAENQIGAWQDGAEDDETVIAGREKATTTASIEVESDDIAKKIDFVEFAWTWDPAGATPANTTTYTYAVIDKNSQTEEITSNPIGITPGAVGDGSLSVTARPYVFVDSDDEGNPDLSGESNQSVETRASDKVKAMGSAVEDSGNKTINVLPLIKKVTFKTAPLELYKTNEVKTANITADIEMQNSHLEGLLGAKKFKFQLATANDGTGDVDEGNLAVDWASDPANGSDGKYAASLIVNATEDADTEFNGQNYYLAVAPIDGNGGATGAFVAPTYSTASDPATATQNIKVFDNALKSGGSSVALTSQLGTNKIAAGGKGTITVSVNSNNITSATKSATSVKIKIKTDLASASGAKLLDPSNPEDAGSTTGSIVVDAEKDGSSPTDVWTGTATLDLSGYKGNASTINLTAEALAYDTNEKTMGAKVDLPAEEDDPVSVDIDSATDLNSIDVQIGNGDSDTIYYVPSSDATLVNKANEAGESTTTVKAIVKTRPATDADTDGVVDASTNRVFVGFQWQGDNTNAGTINASYTGVDGDAVNKASINSDSNVFYVPAELDTDEVSADGVQTWVATINVAPGTANTLPTEIDGVKFKTWAQIAGKNATIADEADSDANGLSSDNLIKGVPSDGTLSVLKNPITSFTFDSGTTTLSKGLANQTVDMDITLNGAHQAAGSDPITDLDISATITDSNGTDQTYVRPDNTKVTYEWDTAETRIIAHIPVIVEANAEGGTYKINAAVRGKHTSEKTAFGYTIKLATASSLTVRADEMLSRVVVVSPAEKEEADLYEKNSEFCEPMEIRAYLSNNFNTSSIPTASDTLKFAWTFSDTTPNLAPATHLANTIGSGTAIDNEVVLSTGSSGTIKTDENTKEKYVSQIVYLDTSNASQAVGKGYYKVSATPGHNSGGWVASTTYGPGSGRSGVYNIVKNPINSISFDETDIDANRVLGSSLNIGGDSKIVQVKVELESEPATGDEIEITWSSNDDSGSPAKKYVTFGTPVGSEISGKTYYEYVEVSGNAAGAAGTNAANPTITATAQYMKGGSVKAGFTKSDTKNNFAVQANLLRKIDSVKVVWADSEGNVSANNTAAEKLYKAGANAYAVATISGEENVGSGNGVLVNWTSQYDGSHGSDTLKFVSSDKYGSTASTNTATTNLTTRNSEGKWVAIVPISAVDNLALTHADNFISVSAKVVATSNWSTDNSNIPSGYVNNQIASDSDHEAGKTCAKVVVGDSTNDIVFRNNSDTKLSAGVGVGGTKSIETRIILNNIKNSDKWDFVHINYAYTASSGGKIIIGNAKAKANSYVTSSNITNGTAIGTGSNGGVWIPRSAFSELEKGKTYYYDDVAEITGDTIEDSSGSLTITADVEKGTAGTDETNIGSTLTGGPVSFLVTDPVTGEIASPYDNSSTTYVGDSVGLVANLTDYTGDVEEGSLQIQWAYSDAEKAKFFGDSLKNDGIVNAVKKANGTYQASVVYTASKVVSSATLTGTISYTSIKTGERVVVANKLTTGAFTVGSAIASVSVARKSTETSSTPRIGDTITLVATVTANTDNLDHINVAWPVGDQAYVFESAAGATKGVDNAENEVYIQKATPSASVASDKTYTAEAKVKIMDGAANSSFKVKATAYSDTESKKPMETEEEANSTIAEISTTANALTDAALKNAEYTTEDLLDGVGSHTLWYNSTEGNTDYKDYTIDLEPNSSEWAIGNTARVSFTWEPAKNSSGNGTISFYQKSGSTYTSIGEDGYMTIAASEGANSSTHYIGTVGMKASGNAEGTIKVTYWAANAGGTRIGNESVKVSKTIKLRKTPIQSTATLSISKKAMAFGGVAQLTLKLPTPYAPGADEVGDDPEIEVALSGAASVENAFTFPGTTGNKITVKKDNYNASEKAYIITQKVQMKSQSSVNERITNGLITATARMYSGSSHTPQYALGFAVSKNTGEDAYITSDGSASTITDIAFNYDYKHIVGAGTDDRELTLGGDGTNADDTTVITATVTSSASLTGTERVAFKWVGTQGAVEFVDETSGLPLDETEDGWEAAVDKTTGEAKIRVKGLKKGDGYFTAKAYPSKATAAKDSISMDTLNISILDYIKSVDLTLVSGANDDELGSDLTTYSIKTARELKLRAVVTLNKGVAAGSIKEFEVNWGLGDESASGVLAAKEGDTDGLSYRVAIADATQGGSVSTTGITYTLPVKSIIANKTYDGTKGTIDAAVTGWRLAGSNNDANKTGTVGGKTANKFVISTNALSGIVAKTTADIFTGQSTENNLEATITSPANANINRVVLTWTAGSYQSTSPTILPDGSTESAAKSISTVLDWTKAKANSENTAKTLAAAARLAVGSVYNGTITVKAQAQSKNSDGGYDNEGDAVSYSFDVSVLGKRTLSLTNTASTPEEVEYIDVMVGTPVNIKTAASGADYIFSDENNSIAAGLMSYELANTVPGLKIDEGTSDASLKITAGAEIVEKTEVGITLIAKKSASYHKATLDATLRIWPNIAESDLVITPKVQTVNSKAKTTFTLGLIDGSKKAIWPNKNNIKWHVYVGAEGTTSNSAVATIRQDSDDPLKAVLTVADGNTTDGTLRVVAEVDNQVASSTPITCTSTMQVESVISKTELESSYATGKTVSVGSTTYWGPKTTTDTAVGPVVLTPASLSDVTYRVDYSEDNIVSVIPLPEGSGVTSHTGGFKVVAEKVGETTVNIYAIRKGVESTPVCVDVKVVKNPLKLELSPGTLKTYAGSTVNLKTILKDSVVSATSGDITNKLGNVVWTYESADSNVAGVSADGTLTAVGEGTTTIKVGAALEKYETAYANLEVNVVDLLKSASITPGEYYMARTADSDGAPNRVQLGVKTNLSTNSGLTYTWSSNSSNLLFKDPNGREATGTTTTVAEPILLVGTAFTENKDDIVVNVKVKQALSGVADGATLSTEKNTEIDTSKVANTNLSIHITNETILLKEGEAGVSLGDGKIVMTNISDAENMTAAIDRNGAKNVKYTWSMVKSRTDSTDPKVATLSTKTAGFANATNGTVDAVCATLTPLASVEKKTEAMVKIVAVQSYTDAGGQTQTITATNYRSFTVYPAVAAPDIYAINVKDAGKEDPDEYGGSNVLLKNEKYALDWRAGKNAKTVAEDYELSYEIVYPKKTEDGVVSDNTSYVSIGEISTGKVAASSDTTGTATIEALEPSYGIDDYAATIKYTLTLKDENGGVVYSTNASKAFSVRDVAVSSISISEGTQAKVSPKETLTITATPNTDATNVDYVWTLEASTDNGTTWSSSYVDSSYLSILGTNRAQSVKVLSGGLSTDTKHRYRIRVTATNNSADSSVAGTKNVAECELIVENDKAEVTNIDILVDGVDAGTGINYLNNSSGSNMILSAKLTPSNAYDKRVRWSVSGDDVAWLLDGSGKKVTTFVSESDVTLVPGKNKGTVTIIAMSESAGMVDSTRVSVLDMPLTGVDIALDEYRDNISDYAATGDSVVAGKTTTLVALPRPRTAAYEKVEWSIVENGNEGAIKIEEKKGSFGEIAVVKGVRGTATGVQAQVKAEIYENSKVVGTSIFGIKVYSADAIIPISKIYLDHTSETVNVGDDKITINATVLPSGATEEIAWSVNDPSTLTADTKGEIVELSTNAGKTVDATPKGGGKVVVAAYGATTYNNYAAAVTANKEDYAVCSIEVGTLSASLIKNVSIKGTSEYKKNPYDKGASDGIDGLYIIKGNETITVSGQGYFNENTLATDPKVTWTVESATVSNTSALSFVAKDDGTSTIAVPEASQSIIIKASCGAREQKYELDVNPVLTAANFTDAANQSYNGAAQAPAISGTYRGIALESGTDFTVTAPADSTNVGDKTATISAGTGGIYTITTPIEKTYKINPIAMSDASVKLSVGNYDKTYNGAAKTPAVSATISGNAYKPAKVTYSSNIDAGTATAKVEGDGKNVTGSKDVTFTINKAASSIVLSNSTLTLTGAKPATIGIKSKAGVASLGFKVTKGGTYASVDKNGKVTGKLVGSKKATVQVTGTGDKNHNNPKAVNVTITVKKPAKVTNKKPTTTKKHTVTANWNKSDSATGYIVQISTSSKFTSKTTTTAYVKKASTTSKKFTKCAKKKLVKGKKYYTRVYAYVGNNKKANRSTVSAKKNVVCK